MDNLISFGMALEDIREGLSLSKVEVFELSGINTETIRRIEYDEVLPKFETLDRFSKIYKLLVFPLILLCWEIICSCMQTYTLSWKMRIEP